MGVDLNSKLSQTQTRQILHELETSHSEDCDNQLEWRRKSNKVENYVEGRQMVMGGPKFGSYYGFEDSMAESEDKDVDKEYFISNEMRRNFILNVQRLTAYNLAADVTPPEKSAKSKNSARAARIFLNHLIRESNPERMKAEVARLLTLHNFCALKVTWDPKAGRNILQPRTGKLGKIFGWALGKERRPEGQVKMNVVSGQNLILPKFCESLKSASRVDEVRAMSVDTAWRTYGVELKPEVIKFDQGAKWNLNRGLNEGGYGPNLPVKDHVLLKERYVEPCARYQRGAIFTWAGSGENAALIRSSNLLDYYPGKPYFGANIITYDKDPMGTSILWDLIPLQNFVNLNMSAAARWLKMLALMRLWVPAESGIDEDDLNNLTGMAAKFEGQKPPIWDQPPELQRSIVELLGISRDLISSYGYSNELAKMKRGLSGNALGILQEMDDTVFKPALESLQAMYSDGSDFALRVATKHMSVPALCRMTSMQGWQMAEFKGDMIDDEYKANVNLMTGMPQNKVMRLEFLKSLYKDGLLTRDEVKSHLEFATDTEALEQVQKQMEIADKRVEDLMAFPLNYEPQETEEGLIYVCKIQYHQFDNHQLLQTKLQVSMQESFDHWGPWVQMAFLEHWEYHKNQAAAELAAQMGPVPGAPEPKFPGPQGPDGMSQLLGGIHTASEQPNRAGIPSPMNAGNLAGAGQAQ